MKWILRRLFGGIDFGCQDFFLGIWTGALLWLFAFFLLDALLYCAILYLTYPKRSITLTP